MSAEHRAIVAIPVRNERHHLKACLDALSAQTRRADAIVLLLNNCDDDSRDICGEAARSCPGIRIVECRLIGPEASAGEARRRALDLAEDLAADGVVLTTDADASVPATWVADNLAEIAAGADCVCGMAIVDPAGCDKDRTSLDRDMAAEALLSRLQDEIGAIVDPDSFDPWPRHQHNSGASIAVRAAILRQAGGAPRIASGEDRALVTKLAAYDARIRHAPQIRVMVSGRMQGRAAGGMAETISRRLQRQDRLTDDMLEPTVDAYRRVLARLRLRAIRARKAEPGAIAQFAHELLIGREPMRAALQTPYFGAAWQAIQHASPILGRRRVAFASLDRETSQALALRDHLRAAAAHPRDDIVWNDLRHAG